MLLGNVNPFKMFSVSSQLPKLMTNSACLSKSAFNKFHWFALCYTVLLLLVLQVLKKYFTASFELTQFC